MIHGIKSIKNSISEILLRSSSGVISEQHQREPNKTSCSNISSEYSGAFGLKNKIWFTRWTRRNIIHPGSPVEPLSQISLRVLQTYPANPKTYVKSINIYNLIYQFTNSYKNRIIFFASRVASKVFEYRVQSPYPPFI